MPTVYSDNYSTGSYTYTRVRVDYSGTSATAILLYSRTNTYSGQTASSGTFSFGGSSTSFNKSFTGQITDAEVARVNFNISLGGGWYSGSTASTTYFAFSGGVSIPSQYTAPTGLGANNLTRGIEEFTANVYVSGWGTNDTPASSKYRELQCWTYDPNNLVSPRRYQATYGSSTSGNITVNNSSSGELTIVGNTMYTIGVYASNGNASTSSQRVGDYTTRAYAPTMSVEYVDDESVEIEYATQADGGKYAKNIQYSLDGGTTWVTAATVNTGSATTETFTISGLVEDTQYTLKCRVSTDAGETDGADVTFRTLESHKLYGSVGGVTKKVTKLYGSVGGTTKEIVKLYGSVGGVTKRIF